MNFGSMRSLVLKSLGNCLSTLRAYSLKQQVNHHELLQVLDGMRGNKGRLALCCSVKVEVLQAQLIAKGKRGFETLGRVGI
jgi:hypothetical protein